MARQIYLRKPSPHLKLVGLIMLVVLTTAATTFWLSTKIAETSFSNALQAADFKDKEIELLKKTIRKLEDEIASLQHSKKFRLAAVAEMKEILRAKDLELLELNQKLHIYRTRYSLDADSAVIRVKMFALHKKDFTTNQFVYELVIASVPARQKKISGVVGLSIDGEQRGVLKRLVFEDIRKITDVSLTFSFKYFQKLSGNFSLPEDFEPSKVHIELLENNNGQSPVFFSYDWGKVYKQS